MTDTFTPSGVWLKQDSSLVLAAIQDEDGQLYAPLQHSVVSALSPVAEAIRSQAVQEFLQAQKLDFWKDAPQYDKKAVEGCVSLKQFNPIPKKEWVALIKLYSHFCASTSLSNELEVGALILVHKETNSLRIAIPDQYVTKASVNWSIEEISASKTKWIYFLDGTKALWSQLDSEYYILGVSHSHNTMATHPSGQDNLCEIFDPQKGIKPTGVHILVGSFRNFHSFHEQIPQFEVYASISHEGKRHQIPDYSVLVESGWEEEWCQWTFHESVLSAIRKTVYGGYNYTVPQKNTPTKTPNKQPDLNAGLAPLASVNRFVRANPKYVAVDAFLLYFKSILSETLTLLYDAGADEEELLEIVQQATEDSLGVKLELAGVDVNFKPTGEELDIEDDETWAEYLEKLAQLDDNDVPDPNDPFYVEGY